MKLEMKSIKHSAFASEETYCYEGYVYVDGKKAIHVSKWELLSQKLPQGEVGLSGPMTMMTMRWVSAR